MDEKEISRKLRVEEEEEKERSLLISSLPSKVEWFELFKYQECWYYYNNLQGVLNFQRYFKPQDTNYDIIVASFPKSGTTWLKALTFALVHRSKHSLSDDTHHPLLSSNPHDLVPYLELDLYFRSSKPDLTKFSSLSSSPRLFSTHMPLHTLHEGLKNSLCKIVYVSRNVKDVFASLWLFHKANKEVEWSRGINGKSNVVEEKFTLEAMFESFCNGIVLYGPFCEHVLSYWRESLECPKNVLFMRYEELKREPQGQIKKLAEFLECPFTKEEEESGSVDKILQLCSLRNLSGLEVNKTGKTWNGIGFNSFFRKGEVGDSKNHLTPEMEKKIDMIVEEKFKGSGLKF